MTVSRDIRLSVIGETRKYQAAMAEIPGVTQKQAARAAVRFEKEMARGQAAAAKEAQKAASQAVDAWDLVGPVIAASLSVDAIKGAVSGVLDFASSTFEARTEVLNLSAATGISTETLAGLEAGVGRVGGNFAEVLGGVEDFGERLFDFSNETGGAKEALELLGFTSAEIGGRLGDVDGVFRDVVERMTQMEDGALKNAAAQQLFSDAGNRLNAVFADTTLDDQIELARRYGQVVEGDSAAATAEWNQGVSELKGILGATAGALLDFLDLGENLRNFTLGFVFLEEVASASFDVLTRRAGEFSAIFALLFEGEFVKANEAWLEFGSTGDDALREVLTRGKEAAGTFFDLTRSVDGATGATERQTTVVGQLSDALKKQQAEAAKASAARARQLAEEERQLSAILTANQAIGRVSAAVAADIVSEEAKIEAAFDARIDALLAAVEAGGSLDAANVAFAAAEERRVRDLAELQRARIEERRVLETELTDDLLALQLTWEEAVDTSLEVRNQAVLTTVQTIEGTVVGISESVGAFIDIQLDKMGQAASEATDALVTLQGQQSELEAAILASTDAQETAALESDLARVESQIATTEAILANRQSEFDKTFQTRKKLEIANALISGAAAVLAALTPPPIGLGPVAGAFAAIPIGLATAATVAQISAQQAPQFHPGFAGFTSGPDEFQATLREGETVNNQRATSALGGASGVAALNATGQVQGAPAPRGGSSLGEFERLLGRMVAQEMGAGRELTRTINLRAPRKGVRPVHQVA